MCAPWFYIKMKSVAITGALQRHISVTQVVEFHSKIRSVLKTVNLFPSNLVATLLPRIICKQT